MGKWKMNNDIDFGYWPKLITYLGFPTFIALILIAVVLGWIKSPLTELLSAQQQEINLLNEHQKATATLRKDLSASLIYQNMLLRTLCRSLVAKQDLLACEPKYQGYEESQQK